MSRPVWRRSSFCNGASTCVEVLPMPDLDVVAVRDSKHPEQEPLVFSLAEWAVFLDGVRAGEFDPEALAAREAGDGSGVDGPAHASEAAVGLEEASPVSL